MKSIGWIAGIEDLALGQLERPRWFAHSDLMNAHDMLPPPYHPHALVGTWRRFGTSGPVYEIVSIGAPSHDSDCLVHIRVVETGEEVDCRLSEVLDDPRER